MVAQDLTYVAFLRFGFCACLIRNILFVPLGHYFPHPCANILNSLVDASSRSLLSLPFSSPPSLSVLPVARSTAAPVNKCSTLIGLNVMVVIFWAA